jgi:formylglycine-generating enzyme required for sulfatase activity
VTGGTFYRGTNTNYPATISDFRLDKYEVTVGRFRTFVDAWVAGWRPSAGSGKHTHVNGGAGLVNTAGGNEPGWDATWTAYVGASSAVAVAPSGAGATTKAAWDTNLSCNSSYQTWTSAAGSNEKRPQNCLSWYDLHAFCIWDGGFLPSEAEWEYAAAGGSEERTYPWGNTAPGANTALAIYGCYYNGTGTCSGVTNIAPVGTVTAGASKAGQLDLAGNVWEWNLDWYQSSYVATCNNCTNLTAGSYRVIRGGSVRYDASNLPAAGRNNNLPANRISEVGGRCARTP